MKKTHLIIGAAAVAAVGLYLYSTRSKTPKSATAAVEPLPPPLTQAKSAASELLASAKNLAATLGITSAKTTAPATATDDVEGDVMTARASDASAELEYAAD